ncbi:hypothetical protein [Nostoc sp. MS1]|uniref:hypothetical protein n=1 Tax=Nostoc sp. MS1 TaxID=2764711 RepID=UPI001CC82235|nr:hypothetical protein [Nostoc sp. MS1]BCL34244.1 hypothetical protein NSMS1_06910 [Nostoc sp. MS1]
MENNQQDELSLAIAAGYELGKFADFLRTINPELTTTEALFITIQFTKELPALVKANPSVYAILEKAAWNVTMARKKENN